LTGESASERPFAFVLQLAREAYLDGELVWVFVAFGPRHPGAEASTSAPIANFTVDFPRRDAPAVATAATMFMPVVADRDGVRYRRRR
jgi:hypothetical protein